MRRTLVRRAAAILAAALALTACIPDTDGKQTPTRVVTAVPGARTGGTLVVATAPLGSLDPATATSPPAQLAASLYCDTLIALDPVTGEARPAIVRSWTIAGRGTKLFLRLRRDVRFHNGRKLVAEDVAWSLDRLAGEDLASDASTLLRSVTGYEFVHGDADTDEERFRRHLAGVQIIDPHSLEITLNGSYSDWLRTLAHPATAPLPREEVERAGAAFGTKPVCTGPYRVARPSKAGEPVSLARFKDYYAGNQAHTRGGRGWVDTIELRPYADRAAEQRAVEAGEADVAHRGEGSPQVSSGVREVSAPTAHIEMIGLPTTTPPFDDPGVRTALAVALDREAISRSVYAGARTPSLSFVPDALSSAHRTAPCPGLQATGDTARARALLSGASVDLRSTTLQIFYNDEHRNRQLVEAVASAWRFAFGMTVQPVALTWGRFLELGTRPTGFQGAFRFGWAPAISSPDAVLQPLFHADGIGRDNLSLFGSRDFADAIRDARRAAVDSDRLRDYRRAEDLVCRAMPMIPIVVAQRRILLSSKVASAISGTGLARSDGEVALRELYVAS